MRVTGDPEELDYDDGMADDEDGDYDCHMDPTTGLCGVAGSFECPYCADRDRIRAAYVKRHSRR